MATRINNAKDFRGKSYIVADALDDVIKSLNFANAGSAITSTNDAQTWKLNFTTADGASANTLAADLTSIKDYIDNKSITVSEGNGISIDTTDPLDPVISTNLKIVKLGTATEGYAASYQLQYLNHNYTSGGEGDTGKEYLPVSGDTIDIVKDQFLKGAELGYGTFIDAATTPTGWTTTKDDTKDAILKLTFAITRTEESAQGAGTATDTDSYVYINVNGMFHDKTAGNGIDATQLASNVIAVKIESATDALTVYTAEGTAVDFIEATASGVKVANVQAAIDTAVANEHSKMASAVSAVDSDLIAFESATNTAVTALNTRIEAVASNAETAATTLEGEIVALDSKVDGAFDALDSAIESAVDAVQTSVTTHTANAVQMLEAEVTPAAGTGDSSAIYTATQSANNIVAVYCSGIQIYPEISRSGSSAPYTYTMTADYGTAQATAEKWTVLYTVALSAYTDVNVADTTYDVTASAAKTVGNGTAATAPSVDSAVTVAATDYKG